MLQERRPALILSEPELRARMGRIWEAAKDDKDINHWLYCSPLVEVVKPFVKLTGTMRIELYSAAGGPPDVFHCVQCRCCAHRFDIVRAATDGTWAHHVNVCFGLQATQCITMPSWHLMSTKHPFRGSISHLTQLSRAKAEAAAAEARHTADVLEERRKRLLRAEVAKLDDFDKEADPRHPTATAKTYPM